METIEGDIFMIVFSFGSNQLKIRDVYIYRVEASCLHSSFDWTCLAPVVLLSQTVSVNKITPITLKKQQQKNSQMDKSLPLTLMFCIFQPKWEKLASS